MAEGFNKLLCDGKSCDCYAVFGNPVLHSKSPQLYNSLFRHNGIDACYSRIWTQTGRDVCEIIRGGGLAGANITTPFKEQVIPYIDELAVEAGNINAVNTIVNSEGKLKGYNTDACGVIGLLREAGTDPSGKRCMVMGAGGAGKAAVAGLKGAGAEVFVSNRTASKGKDVAKQTGSVFIDIGEAPGMLKTIDILVMTLPPGVYPFNKGHLHGGLTIVDANYRLENETSAKEDFQCRIIRGHRWLLHQAVEAYRLFTGQIADTTVMEEGMKTDIDCHQAVIGVIKDFSSPVIRCSDADMFVDGRKLADEQIKRIIDEEKSKAFGNKG